MPQIGWFEILTIVAISIIVIGPKDFPIVLKKIGSWIGSVKRYIGKLQQEVTDLNPGEIDIDKEEVKNKKAVSYTHLTLPTIYSV